MFHSNRVLIIICDKKRAIWARDRSGYYTAFSFCKSIHAAVKSWLVQKVWNIRRWQVRISPRSLWSLLVPPPHCSTVMLTRLTWHSGFFAWFILLWPRHDHFSSQIKMRGVQFWKTNQFVVTESNLWIILWNQFLLILLQSKVSSIKLWPRLKFWHWSLYC